MRPSISVVIPSHNRPRLLGYAVASVGAQSKLPSELIVVDDGSNPRLSADEYRRAAGNIPLRLIRNDVPCGGGGARNAGIENAKGDWVVFLDDDDEFAPTKVEWLLSTITENPSADVLYHPARVIMENEGVEYTTRPARFSPCDDVFRSLLTRNKIGGTSMVAIRRSLLLEEGGFDIGMPALQDYELWLRLAKRGARFELIDEPLTRYRCLTSSENISHDLHKNSAALKRIEERFGADYDQLGSRERKLYDCWKLDMIVHKAMLCGDYRRAVRAQWRKILRRPSPGAVGLGLTLLAGTKAAFRVRQLLG